MGTIQSSLNALTMSAIGAIGGVAYGFKGAFKEPKVPQAQGEQPKAETTSGMGNIAKVGRDYSRAGMRSYTAAAKAVQSGNDMIAQKASARFISPEERIAQIKAATGTTFAAPQTKEKGGSK